MIFAPGVKIYGLRPELAAVIPTIGHLIGIHTEIKAISPTGNTIFIEVPEAQKNDVLEDFKRFLPSDMILKITAGGVSIQAPLYSDYVGKMELLSPEEKPQSHGRCYCPEEWIDPPTAPPPTDNRTPADEGDFLVVKWIKKIFGQRSKE